MMMVMTMIGLRALGVQEYVTRGDRVDRQSFVDEAYVCFYNAIATLFHAGFICRLENEFSMLSQCVLSQNFTDAWFHCCKV